MRYLIGLVLGLIGIATAAFAVDTVRLPTRGLADYGVYRAALVADGWKPIWRRTGVEFSGDLDCDNTECTAWWKSKSGQEVEITVWKVNNRYVVAPAASPLR